MQYPKAIIKKCEPEVTENEVVIDECRLVEIPPVEVKSTDGKMIMQDSGCIELSGKAFVLSDSFDFVIVHHNMFNYLIPLKKENS